MASLVTTVVSVIPTLDLLGHVRPVFRDGAVTTATFASGDGQERIVNPALQTLSLLENVAGVALDGAVTTVTPVPGDGRERIVLRDVQWDGLVSTVTCVNLDSAQKATALNVSRMGAGRGSI